MGHSSKHIGLDCPKWSFADGQSRIAECLRSGGGGPKFHDCGDGNSAYRHRRSELELSQTHEAPCGTLRVSLPLVGMLMMPTLVAFMRAHPEIILDLDFSDRVVDVIEEGFDAVVRFAEVGDSRLMTRALGTYRRRLVAAPAYLAAKGVPLIPDDLKAHACLHHKFPTSGKFERWPLRA